MLLELLGWIWVAAGVWMLVVPRGYESFAQGILGAFSDATTLRIIGVLSAGFGVALAWFAFELGV